MSLRKYEKTREKVWKKRKQLNLRNFEKEEEMETDRKKRRG